MTPVMALPFLDVWNEWTGPFKAPGDSSATGQKYQVFPDAFFDFQVYRYSSLIFVNHEDACSPLPSRAGLGEPHGVQGCFRETLGRVTKAGEAPLVLGLVTGWCQAVKTVQLRIVIRLEGVSTQVRFKTASQP